MKTLNALALLTCIAALPLGAQAQATSYDAMMQRALADNARLTQNINQSQNNLVQQAMQNPHISEYFRQVK